MPGCGKSTLMRRLAGAYDAPVYLEPEENVWPAAVSDRDRSGHATALQYFRSTRVPLLYEARSRADEGSLVFIDSIYDKLFYLYIEEPEFSWLIAPSDPYFENSRDLARLDYERLPSPDVLIFFRVAGDDWARMVRDRGRSFDRDAQIDHYLGMQSTMLEAAQVFERAANGAVRLIIFDNSYCSLDLAAENLMSTMESTIIKS